MLLTLAPKKSRFSFLFLPVWGEQNKQINNFKKSLWGPLLKRKETLFWRTQRKSVSLKIKFSKISLKYKKSKASPRNSQPL